MESLEEIDNIIENLDDMNDFQIQIAFEHLYHHVNCAWNGRNRRSNKKITGKEVIANSKFPTDIIPHCADESAQQGDAPEPATYATSASQRFIPPAR